MLPYLADFSLKIIFPCRINTVVQANQLWYGISKVIEFDVTIVTVNNHKKFIVFFIVNFLLYAFYYLNNVTFFL